MPARESGTGAVAYDAATGAVLPRGTEVVAQPSAGDAIAVASGHAGDSVTMGTGPAGTIAKTGRGRLSVATLPADAPSVTVSGGVLRLAPANAPAAVDSIAADPEYRSFEEFFTDYASSVYLGRLFWGAGEANKRGGMAV